MFLVLTENQVKESIYRQLYAKPSVLMTNKYTSITQRTADEYAENIKRSQYETMSMSNMRRYIVKDDDDEI